MLEGTLEDLGHSTLIDGNQHLNKVVPRDRVPDEAGSSYVAYRAVQSKGAQHDYSDDLWGPMKKLRHGEERHKIGIAKVPE